MTNIDIKHMPDCRSRKKACMHFALLGSLVLLALFAVLGLLALVALLVLFASLEFLASLALNALFSYYLYCLYLSVTAGASKKFPHYDISYRKI